MADTNLNVDLNRLGVGIRSSKYQSDPINSSYVNVGAAYGIIEKRVTVSVPDFRHLRKTRAILPMNPFSYKRELWTGWLGQKLNLAYPDLSENDPRQNWQREEQFVNASAGERTLVGRDLSAAMAASLDGKARNKILLKLKDQKVNVAQVIAERAQAKRLIGDSAIAIANSLRALTKGDITGAANALGIKAGRRFKAKFNKAYGAATSKRSSRNGKTLSREQSEALSQGWLGLQYGWRPIVSDIFGACEMLANLREKPEQIMGIVSHKEKIKTTDVLVDIVENGGPNKCLYTDEIEYSVKYTLQYATRASIFNTQTLGQAGITNPLMIAWELLPWSFVIDWFLPIGNWINTFDSHIGLTFIQGCKTTFQKVNGKALVTKDALVYGRHLIDRYEATKVRVDCNRTVLTSFPMPFFPEFKNPLSLEHALNAMALLSQLSKK